jgi:hypothetical protein
LDDYIAFAPIVCCENTKERRDNTMIAHILVTVAAFSWIVDTSLPSIVLFGEYPYPSEENE